MNDQNVIVFCSLTQECTCYSLHIPKEGFII